jgi:hypothetical protein
MPYTTSYVDDGRGMHKMGSGLVTGLELLSSALEQSLDEARARKLRYGLVDFSETTDMNVTPADIRRLVEMNRKTASYTPGAFIAIVAPSPLPYALARLWHTLADDLGWNANVFHTRSDAIAWLRKQLLSREDSDATLSQYPSLKTEP